MFKINEVFENEIFENVDITVKSCWKQKVYAYIKPFPYIGTIEGDSSDTEPEMPRLDDSSNTGSEHEMFSPASSSSDDNTDGTPFA